ncbi:MAG TPA: RDD family protein [Methylomirabilota bacterium]|nr:RDD family protein [Methylomirabilota bacterium]
MSISATYAGVEARPAGFWIRVMANIVDVFILFAVQFAIGLVVGIGLASSGAAEVTVKGMTALLELGGWVLGFVYVVGFIALKGQTPGKMALGLRVVRDDGNEPVGWGTALMREVLGKILSSLVLGLGYLMVAFREDKRGLHDRLARTSVLKG